MSGKPDYIKQRMTEEENLLTDLNNIANFAIGNQAPEDCSFNERDTLPEALSYAMTYPESPRAVKEALDKMKELQGKVNALYNKVQLMKTKIDVKNRKLYD